MLIWKTMSNVLWSFQPCSAMHRRVACCKSSNRTSKPLGGTHHIYLEVEAESVRQPQRRLNPHMQEVVKEEFLKLLQAGIIYPISDSTWVSLTQVVPKKSGVTTVHNEKGEEIPTRLTIGD